MVRRSFQSTWRCTGAIRSTSLDVACPAGLLRKPLDATIGQLLTPYCLSGRQGDNRKMTMQNTPPLLAISMVVLVRRYYTTHINRWRRLMAFLKATKRHHWASTCSDITQLVMPTPDLGGMFHHQIV